MGAQSTPNGHGNDVTNKQTKLDARVYPDVRARDGLDQDGPAGAAAWAGVAGVHANTVRSGGGRGILVLLAAADGQVGALAVVCEGESVHRQLERAVSHRASTGPGGRRRRARVVVVVVGGGRVSGRFIYIRRIGGRAPSDMEAGVRVGRGARRGPHSSARGRRFRTVPRCRPWDPRRPCRWCG